MDRRWKDIKEITYNSMGKKGVNKVEEMQQQGKERQEVYKMGINRMQEGYKEVETIWGSSGSRYKNIWGYLYVQQ